MQATVLVLSRVVGRPSFYRGCATIKPCLVPYFWVVLTALIGKASYPQTMKSVVLIERFPTENILAIKSRKLNDTIDYVHKRCQIIKNNGYASPKQINKTLAQDP